MKKIFLMLILSSAMLLSSNFTMAYGDGEESELKPYNACSVGLNLGYCLPLGYFGDSYSGSLGFGGNFEYKIQREVGLIANIGFTSWKFSDDTDKTISFKTIPVMLGGRYYFSTEATEYYGEVALGMTHQSFKDSDNPYENNDATEFAYSLAIGSKMPLYEFLKFNFSAVYTNCGTDISSFSYIGLNIGVVAEF